MTDQKANFKTEKELQEAILQEKAKGTPDIEIGQLLVGNMEETRSYMLQKYDFT